MINSGDNNGPSEVAYPLPQVPSKCSQLNRIPYCCLGCVDDIFLCLLVGVAMQGVSKGIVAEKILSSMVESARQADFVLCVGDDRSDEDMFEAIAGVKTKDLVAANTSVFACTVGQKPSKARYYLDDTNDVINMLGALADVSDLSSPTPEPTSPTSGAESDPSPPHKVRADTSPSPS